MQQVHKDRLLMIADKLEESHVQEHFDYASFVHRSTWDGSEDLVSCGTAACAIGWGTTVPALRELGLHLDNRGMPTLGLGEPHWCSLFGAEPRDNDTDDEFTRRAVIRELFFPTSAEEGMTAKQVAQRIRDFVSTR